MADFGSLGRSERARGSFKSNVQASRRRRDRSGLSLARTTAGETRRRLESRQRDGVSLDLSGPRRLRDRTLLPHLALVADPEPCHLHDHSTDGHGSVHRLCDQLRSPGKTGRAVPRRLLPPPIWRAAQHCAWHHRRREDNRRSYCGFCPFRRARDESNHRHRHDLRHAVLGDDARRRAFRVRRVWPLSHRQRVGLSAIRKDSPPR